LATFKGTDEEHTRLGAVIRNLMLDAIDLVLQHGLRRDRERKPENGAISDASALGPAATVVGQRSDVADQGDFQTGNLKCSDGGLTS